jgi:undecaprenyl-diphosphatase
VNQRSAFYWVVVILIAALLIGLAFYLDDSVRHFIAQHQSRGLRQFMQGVSRFGDWPEHFVFGLILAAVAWWRGRKKWTRIFLCMLIALAIAGLAGRVIQITTGRARPSVKTEQVWNGIRFGAKYHAFPSGHVGASSAFFGVLVFVRRRVGLICMAIPLLIGISRIYLEAHYLSDVLCAAILGLLCAFFTTRVFLRPIGNYQLEI